VAAKAQLHIGLCRLAQGRPQDAAAAFLAVPMTYDYPELGYAAYLEAARAYEAGQSLELAIKTLEKLIALAPAESDWNKKAKEKLAQLKK
jgi:tetratricopeptide (TPR) repeat protein